MDFVRNSFYEMVRFQDFQKFYIKNVQLNNNVLLKIVTL